MQTYRRDGLTFDVADHGPAGGATVVLLHGFPQTSLSWTAVAGELARSGYRTLAPDQRGYSPGARPPDRRAYRMPELVADVAALIEAAGSGPVHVAGHDWGASVAWMLAAHRPELVRTVTALSVPHPGAYLKSLRTSRQGLRSWYMLALQVPALPEWLFERPGMVERFLTRSGQSPEAAARDAAAIAGDHHGPISWYRGLPLTPPGWERRPVTRPALQIWGDRDPFVGRAAIDANPGFIDAPYTLRVIPGAGHWLPDQAPHRVAELLIEHITEG